MFSSREGDVSSRFDADAAMLEKESNAAGMVARVGEYVDEEE